MQRVASTPRSQWRARLEDLGMELGPAPSSPYWSEDAAYIFSETEVECLHDSVTELELMVAAAVSLVVERDLFAMLGIVPALAEVAEKSWRAREPSLYGRYDLRFDGKGPLKLLEYNADTLTALFEASIVQWHWLQELHPDADQFNSIHEGLFDAWRHWRTVHQKAFVHMGCVFDDDDDLLTTAYLADVATQAGLETRLIQIGDIGCIGRRFLDLEHREIVALFKLYPWDWLAREAFFPALARSQVAMIEPAWRVIASSKGLLAVLWKLFPEHPNLLPAGFDSHALAGPVVFKPVLGREGANVSIRDGARTLATAGPYTSTPHIAQCFMALPNFDGWYPVIGAWVAGGKPHGIGIREDRSLITGRGARFVPHFIG